MSSLLQTNQGSQLPSYYLNPKVGKIMAQNPLNIAQKAIILHTLGVQVSKAAGSQKFQAHSLGEQGMERMWMGLQSIVSMNTWKVVHLVSA